MRRAWSSPETVNLTLALGRCSLDLPVRPPEATPAAMPIPILHAAVPTTAATAPGVVTAPVAPGRYRNELDSPPQPATNPETGLTTARGRREISEFTEGDPNSGRWRHEAESRWTRGDWDCGVRATIELTSTPSEFVLSESVTATQRGKTVFERRRDSRIPRRLV